MKRANPWLKWIRQAVRIGFVCLLLNACSSSHVAEGQKAVELVLVTPGNYLDAVCFKQIERLQKDYPLIHVQIVTAPGMEYYTKVLTMMAGRARVDVAWMGEGLGMFISRGALLNLDSLIQNDPDFQLDSYFKPVLNLYKHNGKFYGFPYGIDLQVMAYNKDLFDQAGVPYMDDSWTLEDLLKAAKKLTTVTGANGRVHQYGLNVEDIHYGVFGANLFTPDDRRFALNNSDGLAWLKFNMDLVHVHKVLPSQIDSQSLDHLAAFYMGHTAIADCFTWNLSELKKRANFRWDIAMVPKGKRRSAWASSAGFAISAHTQHPKESWLLLKYLVSPELQRMVIHELVPTYIPLQSEYTSANLPSPEHAKAFVDSLPYLCPTPRIGCLSEVNAELNHWKQCAMLNQLTAEKALMQAEVNVNKILEEYRNR